MNINQFKIETRIAYKAADSIYEGKIIGIINDSPKDATLKVEFYSRVNTETNIKKNYTQPIEHVIYKDSFRNITILSGEVVTNNNVIEEVVETKGSVDRLTNDGYEFDPADIQVGDKMRRSSRFSSYIYTGKVIEIDYYDEDDFNIAIEMTKEYFADSGEFIREVKDIKHMNEDNYQMFALLSPKLNKLFVHSDDIESLRKLFLDLALQTKDEAWFKSIQSNESEWLKELKTC